MKFKTNRFRLDVMFVVLTVREDKAGDGAGPIRAGLKPDAKDFEFF